MTADAMQGDIPRMQKKGSKKKPSPPPSPPIEIKPINKSTCREHFFANPLEVDDQMKWMGEDVCVVPDARVMCGEPITYAVACTLRMLLFGSCQMSFSNSWREQSLCFFKSGYYGLKFHKDGPVEVMTPLQCYVLKHLLFEKKNTDDYDASIRLSPSAHDQQQLLVAAMVDMLWSVGEKKRTIVALPIGTCSFVSDFNYKNDEITEKLQLFKLTTHKDLEAFLTTHLCKFQDCHGCILLLYSLMLTHGLADLHTDCEELQHGMLEISTPLRSQSIINLCIHGRAVPNVFNNEVEVFNETLEKSDILKGVDRRCNFGFLSSREALDKKSYEVGSCLKTPRYPVWVLNNNSRLCVLFCLKRGLLSDWKLERRFDLYLFQGIPRHLVTEELDIRLTIDTIQTFVKDPDEEDVSTLEETIRTKWMDSVIEWNGFARF